MYAWTLSTFPDPAGWYGADVRTLSHAVFWLVFTLHGHSMTGGFAATIAALLAGVFFPRMIRGAWK